MLPKFDFQRFQLVFLLLIVSSACAEEYRIVTTWDNRTIDHADKPVIVQLDRKDASSFKISVAAPFFNDPPKPPGGEVGEPFFGLWDYEVVEVFFLNDLDQYVEIEFCPWGQHIVLLLNGYRKMIRHSLFIDFKVTSRTGDYWKGEAIIPVDLLPLNVTKMNAYAIHGSDPDKRVYESLYPVPFNSSAGADFHKLDAFQPFDRNIILTADVSSYSQTWTDSFEGIRRLKIDHTWNGALLGEKEAVDLEIETRSGTGLVVKVSAPFYDDVPPPPGPSGWPFNSLSSYEFTSLFLVGGNNVEALEIQLGPWGHYDVIFWSGSSNLSNFHPEIVYQVDRQDSTEGKRWIGTAMIPFAYLPPQVFKCNAHSAHGPSESRQINSLYPTSGILSPNLHNQNSCKAIDMTTIYPGNDNATCSDVWTGKVRNCPVPVIPDSAGHTQTANHLAFLLAIASIASFIIL